MAAFSLSPSLQVWSALEPHPAPEKLPAAGHLQQRQLAPHTAALQGLEVTPPQLAQTAVAKLVLQVRQRVGGFCLCQMPDLSVCVSTGSAPQAIGAGRGG
jgi:hypothetical protein